MLDLLTALEEQEMLRGMTFDGYLTNNGQIVYDGSWNLLRTVAMVPDEVRALVDYCDERSLPLWLVSEQRSRFNYHFNDRVPVVMAEIHTEIPERCNLHTMLQEPVVKAVMFLTAQEVREGPLSFMPHARSTQWFIHGQDIIPAEGGKLPAMRFMAEANGWTPDELMAFGDSENDNEMLRYAGTGVAMGNALEETKAASDYVTDDCDDEGVAHALAAKFCNGTTVTCDGLSQWGSQELAQQGLSSVEILRRYYGEDIEIVRNAPMRGYAPSYGGTPLRRGSRGPQVVQLQVMLNRIGQNYPAIPRVASVDGIFGTQTENAALAAQRIFNLDPDGIVGKGTWYQLVRLYVAVTELSELASQGQTFYAVNWQYSRVLREGSTGEPVRVLQYMLQVIGSYINDVPMPPQTGIFGELTANSVRAFQRFSGLAIDGIVGEQTWNAIFDRLAGIAETGPLPQDVAQEITEEVGYLVQTGVIPNFPGQILRLGDSDT